MKIRPVGAKFFMRTQRRTDRCDENISSFTQFLHMREQTSNKLLENIATVGINKIKGNNMLYIDTNTENAPFFLC
jgi:hypothetical protein